MFAEENYGILVPPLQFSKREKSREVEAVIQKPNTVVLVTTVLKIIRKMPMVTETIIETARREERKGRKEGIPTV